MGGIEDSFKQLESKVNKASDRLQKAENNKASDDAKLTMLQSDVRIAAEGTRDQIKALSKDL